MSRTFFESWCSLLKSFVSSLQASDYGDDCGGSDTDGDGDGDETFRNVLQHDGESRIHDLLDKDKELTAVGNLNTRTLSLLGALQETQRVSY